MRKPSPATVMAFLALVFAMGGFAIAANQSASDPRIRACVAKKSGDLRVVKRKAQCDNDERFVKWNKKGRTGATGSQGEQGIQGPPGAPAGFGGEAAGGVLSGEYPDPGFAPGAVNTTALADGAVTASKIPIVSTLAESALNADAPKEATATCPSGSTIVSGSVGVTDGLNPYPSGVALSYAGGRGFLNGWYGRAYEPNSNVSSNWQIQVVAICIEN